MVSFSKNVPSNNNGANNYRAHQILANGLITLGVVSLFTIFALTQFASVTSSFAKTEIPVQEVKTEIPTKISVGGKINNLEVIPGEINQGQWDLSQVQA